MAAAQAFLLQDAVPLLTLTGPGGVGKTRLALAVAHGVAGHFAAGVVFVDLSPLTDPEFVPATIATAVEIAAGADHAVTAAIVTHLRRRQCLLVLDNCEHVLAVTARLVAMLLAHCPALQCLATSRAPLSVQGEFVMPVPPLQVPAVGAVELDTVRAASAVTLFAQRARAADPHFTLREQNAAAVAAVCQQLDGLPLALELAAARANVLTPEAMLALFGRRFQFLGAGTHDAPARHQTMHDAIAWSHDLLPPADQASFHLLSIFTGGWTLEAAAAVSDLPLPTTLNHTERLLRQSLIVRQVHAEPATPRFTMLETIREFGLARLRETGDETEIRNRHASYFRDLAERAELHLHGVSGDQAAWMAQMDQEYGNLGAAIDWLLASGDPTSALRLLVGIEAYIGARPIEAEARRWTETALRLATDAPVTLRAAALYGLISRTAQLGDIAAAVSAAETAVAITTTSEDPFVVGRAHYGLGMARSWSGDLAGAAAAYTRSVPYFRRTDRTDFLGIALASLGMTHLGDGNLNEARALLDESLVLWQEIDDPTWSSGAFFLRGLLASAEGDHLLAVQMLTESLDSAGSVHFERAVHEAVAGLAGVALASGQPERAARLLGATAASQEAKGISDVTRDPLLASILAAARDTLGDAAYQAAFTVGRAIPWPSAVADARAVLEPPTPHAPGTQLAWPAAGADLTHREHDVLALLCQRLTDAEIAEQLFISPYTASKHVSNVLGKLGVANRRQAAAFAVRHGLI